MKIFCIHGNFQTAKVWQPLEERMKAGFSDLEMITEDLCAKQFQSFDDWTEDFCGRVDAKANGEKSILLGYSLGGRLALHACLSRPDLWKSAIVVGAKREETSIRQRPELGGKVEERTVGKVGRRVGCSVRVLRDRKSGTAESG